MRLICTALSSSIVYLLYAVLFLISEAVVGQGAGCEDGTQCQRQSCLDKLDLFSSTCNQELMPISGLFNDVENAISLCCWDGGCCAKLDSILECLEDCTLLADEHTDTIQLVARFATLCHHTHPLPPCLLQPQQQKYSFNETCPSIVQQMHDMCSPYAPKHEQLLYNTRAADKYNQQCCWPQQCCQLTEQFYEYKCDTIPFNNGNFSCDQETKSSQIFTNYYTYYINGIADLWGNVCDVQSTQNVRCEGQAKVAPFQHEIDVNNGTQSEQLQISIPYDQNTIIIGDLDSNTSSIFQYDQTQITDMSYLQNSNEEVLEQPDSSLVSSPSEDSVVCQGDMQDDQDYLNLYYLVGDTFCSISTFEDLDQLKDNDVALCCDVTFKILSGLCDLYVCGVSPVHKLDEASMTRLSLWSVVCLHQIQDCSLSQLVDFVTQSSSKINIPDELEINMVQATTIIPQQVIDHQDSGIVPQLIDPEQARQLTVFEALQSIPSLSTLNIASQLLNLESKLSNLRPITFFAPSNQGFEQLLQEAEQFYNATYMLDMIGTEPWNRDLGNHVALTHIHFTDGQIFDNGNGSDEVCVETYSGDKLSLRRYSTGEVFLFGCCEPQNYAKVMAAAEFADGVIVQIDGFVYAENGLVQQLRKTSLSG